MDERAAQDSGDQLPEVESAAVTDPTAGRSAGSDLNTGFDPTRGIAAGTDWNTEQDPTRAD
jgi:hypothetical protein